MRMMILSSPGGQTCWLDRLPAVNLPTEPEKFPSIVDAVLLFLKAQVG